jgi:hypothetical protein
MEQTLFAVAPPWCSAGKCTLLCVQGREARHPPCHSAAHCRHMKRQPFLVSVVVTTMSSLPLLLPLPLQSPSLSLSPLPLLSAIAVPITLGHRHCHCRWPLLLLLPLPSAIAIAVAVDVAVVVIVASAIAISIGHQHCHCHCKHHLPRKRKRPSLESCPLCAATIIFKQFKQIMITLFYFVQTVSGALNAADD